MSISDWAESSCPCASTADLRGHSSVCAYRLQWKLKYLPGIVTGAHPDLTLGVRPYALLFELLYELAVKGPSVAVLSEYTEGSDCSIHRDTMWIKGGPGLSAKIPLTLMGLARLHSYPCCSTIAKTNMTSSSRAGWCNNPEGLLCAGVEWGFSSFSECSSSFL